MSCSNSNTSVTPIDPCNECEETKYCCDEVDYVDTGCITTMNDECIINTNADIACTDIVKGDSVKSVILKLANMVKGLFGKVTSTSLAVTRTGTCQDNLKIELVPSTDANNQLIIGTDNRPYAKRRDVNIVSIPYLTFTKAEVNGVLTFTPVLDIAGLVSIVCQGCGTTGVCDNPTGLVVVGNLQSDNTVTLTVTWTMLPTIAYDVKVDGVMFDADTVSPLTIPNLDPSTVYNIEVISKCGNGETGSTDDDITTPSLPTCNLPSNLNVNLS